MSAEAGTVALVCPYCYATWEPNGVPRDAPRWERWPDLYHPPRRAVERAERAAKAMQHNKGEAS